MFRFSALSVTRISRLFCATSPFLQTRGLSPLSSVSLRSRARPPFVLGAPLCRVDSLRSTAPGAHTRSCGVSQFCPVVVGSHCPATSPMSRSHVDGGAAGFYVSQLLARPASVGVRLTPCRLAWALTACVSATRTCFGVRGGPARFAAWGTGTGVPLGKECACPWLPFSELRGCLGATCAYPACGRVGAALIPVTACVCPCSQALWGPCPLRLLAQVGSGHAEGLCVR